MTNAGAVPVYATPEQRERLKRIVAESQLAFRLDYLQERLGISREAALRMVKP